MVAVIPTRPTLPLLQLATRFLIGTSRLGQRLRATIGSSMRCDHSSRLLISPIPTLMGRCWRVRSIVTTHASTTTRPWQRPYATPVLAWSRQPTTTSSTVALLGSMLRWRCWRRMHYVAMARCQVVRPNAHLFSPSPLPGAMSASPLASSPQPGEPMAFPIPTSR